MKELWSSLVQWVDIHAVSPFLALTHLNGLAGDPREIAGALLIALIQVLVIGCIFRPLETFAPAERWSDRRYANMDRTFTLIMLFILNPLFAYLVLTPLANWFGGADTAAAGAAYSGLASWIPWFQQHPYVLFGVYYLAYDFTYYWLHRIQHVIPWWWALHSMHHSQRQTCCWTNDRTNYVDGVIQSFALASVGLLLGVDPDQFALLMFIGELVQNLSHTNVRWGFGRVFERIFVDPKFHRLHHMRVDPDRPHLHNCNFGQVLSIWDIIFGTALYNEPVRETGVGDPMVDIDNELGFAMQWASTRRFWGALWTRAGWKPGDVAFNENYKPVSTVHMDLHRFDRHTPAATGGALPASSNSPRK